MGDEGWAVGWRRANEESPLWVAAAVTPALGHCHPQLPWAALQGGWMGHMLHSRSSHHSGQWHCCTSMGKGGRVEYGRRSTKQKPLLHVRRK